MDTKKVYTNGLVTVSLLTEEEAHRYRNMVPGVYVTSNMIQSVAENDEEKQILEQPANGSNAHDGILGLIGISQIGVLPGEDQLLQHNIDQEADEESAQHHTHGGSLCSIQA